MRQIAQRRRTNLYTEAWLSSRQGVEKCIAERAELFGLIGKAPDPLKMRAFSLNGSSLAFYHKDVSVRL